MNLAAFAERFWIKVDVRASTECWPWLAAPDDRGVGVFWLDGRTYKAPQLAWCLLNGQEWPAGMIACHACDNPPCVNPYHIWPGTHQDNVDDMTSKGRHPHGATHGAAVLSENDIRAIRVLITQGQYTYEEIGARFGVSRWQISNIARGKHWSHI